MTSPTKRRSAEDRLRGVLRLGQGPRWGISLLFGLVLMVVGATGIIVLGIDLKTMHPPGQPGYTLAHFYGPPDLDVKVDNWSDYWEDLADQTPSSSPLAIAMLTWIVDFTVFIPGYLLAALTVFGQSLKRSKAGHRLKIIFLIATLLILIVTVLDLSENFISLYLVSAYWSEPGRQPGPLDVVLQWITGTKWTLVAAVFLAAVCALLFISRSSSTRAD